ncbi:MAG: hypothetical protein IIA67_09760, partial [Planctomycetes bacterium]|nr:hypothetical protein [Planctomycetota bacterium]
MIGTTWQQRRDLESLDRAALAEHQLARLNRLLEVILPANHFYAEKFGPLELPLTSLDQLAALPFTFKDELTRQQRDDGLAPNHTFPLDQYVRFHQTSGTRGRPMVVLDTADDWRWWIDAWQFVLDAADLQPGDRAMMAFSFGPFIGFWSAYDAAAARGLLVVPGGGMILTGDTLHPWRIFEIGRCLDDGQLPCRWAAELGNGYGLPLFNYYPPLPYYAGDLLHRLGFPYLGAVNGLYVLGLIGAGLAMFTLANRLWGALGGLVSGVAYVYAPYLALDI